MNEKIIAKYLGEEVEIPIENLLHIEFQIGKRGYRVQRKCVLEFLSERDGDELKISVNSQLVIHPRTSNCIWLKEKDW